MAMSAGFMVRAQEELVARYVGSRGVRDACALEACVGAPWVSFGGELLYSSPVERAVKCAFEVARQHPFLDGNKRVAGAVLLTWLRASGYRVTVPPLELATVIVSVAAGELDYDGFLSVISGRIVSM